MKSFVALEWLQPGEGEETAALRLLGKIPQMYGSRFFDILLLDALYAQTAVFNLAEKVGWDLVVSLKQNQRDLYQSAIRLFARRAPACSSTEKHAGKTYEVQLWDAPGLPFSGQNPRLVRVVRSEETVTENHYRQGKLQAESTSHEWVWATTLEPRIFPTKLVRELGHDRWKLENNGWNDLTQHWAFKHGFLHACRHRPNVTGSDGERRPVPNRGPAAVTLILLLAFTLCASFTLRHSKLFRLYRMSSIEVAHQLRRSLSQPAPYPRAGFVTPLICFSRSHRVRTASKEDGRSCSCLSGYFVKCCVVNSRLTGRLPRYLTLKNVPANLSGPPGDDFLK